MAQNSVMSGLVSFFSGIFDNKIQLSDDSGVLMSKVGCVVSDTKLLIESTVGNSELESQTNSNDEFIQEVAKVDSDHHQELVINCLSVKSNVESSDAEKIEVGEKSTQTDTNSEVSQLEEKLQGMLCSTFSFLNNN